MLDASRLWRQFLNSSWLQAGAMGLLATALAFGLSAPASTTFTALDWTAYDFWLTDRAPIPVSPALVIVTRDPVSEEEFGTGPWDRAILARLVTSAHESGALAIGLDHRLDRASPAQLGGAVSDALLLEAMSTAGPIVVVQSPDATLASDATIAGHLLVTTHSDHVARTVPEAETSDRQSVPAFGIALYEAFQQQPSPTKPSLSEGGTASLLVNYVGNGTINSFPTVPISSIWNAIEHHESDRLIEWFKGKVVVFLPNAIAGGTSLLPTGQTVTNSVVHLHVLNMLMTDNRLYQLDAASRSLITLFVAWLVSWLLLQFRGTTSLIFAGTAIAIYGALIFLALVTAHLVLPLTLPLTAALLVLVGTTIWSHLTAHQRLMLLEQDMLRLQQEAVAVREALVLRETRAETLQEDLAVARAGITQSTGQQEELTRSADVLRSQLADAQAQEDEARRKLEELEHQLHGLRAATSEPLAMGDVELDRLRDECRQLGIITQDHGLLRLYRDLKKGAKSPLTVLVLGEPGTGKELVARAVHRLSPRTGKTFIAVNMAAIPPELFESELFGHTKGSFTGATADRKGYFEMSNHGTIFLDEIGDLRLDHQSKLLRVLQEKSFYRVGATIPTTVDVRIVAATNRDLQRGVSEGWFREDLYFRLTGLVFRLPPLRERTGDVPILAEIFLNEIAGQMSKPVPKLSNEALRALVEQEWKGNVREFRHCLEQAIALNDGPLLTKESLRLGSASPSPAGRAKPSQILPDPASDAAVLNCLRQHSFDMQATAKTLGWDRSTVTQRLKGLCFQALVEADGDQTKAALAISTDPSHLRTIELKLMDYHSHLMSVIEPFATANEALLDCKRRFKNLPDRHFSSVETLVRQYFRQDGPTSLGLRKGS
ncbi:MAG TPA: sigma 54-interacting transcriptional regulator [Nitrospiraceae bacterium]|jgi:transcriptional regulator with PAS, ATPase and Fis domain|nr:sigma 54-interacting transcriptional regulator [Nitrospiraceae bacterium]